jgi:hypothetical protein
METILPLKTQTFQQGDIFGFCEITQHLYRLGSVNTIQRLLQPVLTNLKITDETMLEAEDYNDKPWTFMQNMAIMSLLKIPPVNTLM